MNNLSENEELRYSKQLILDGFGIEAQNKLSNARVLVVGAGGLGSPTLLYLASVGVGTIGIVEFDTITHSNLNRQILYSTNDLGLKKIDVAAKRLTVLNPNIMLELHDTRLNINNAEEIISEYDVVIDATDNFSTRYLISDCCYFLKKPLIEGAATAYDGILMTIIPDKTPCYRCLYPNPPKDGVLPNCSEVGIIGMLTGIVGSAQALEAVKLITGIGENLTGKLLTIDALSTGFREIKWDRKETCPLCGKHPEIHELMEYKVELRKTCYI